MKLKPVLGCLTNNPLTKSRFYNGLIIKKFAFVPTDALNNEEKEAIRSADTKVEDLEKEYEEAVNTFVSSINKVDVVEPRADMKSIEAILKTINHKGNKQASDINLKLRDLFSSTSDENRKAKIFVALHEISKVNLNSTSKLLRLLLADLIFHRLHEDEMDTNKYKFNASSYLYTINAFLLAFLAYLLYQKTEPNYKKIATKLLAAKDPENNTQKEYKKYQNYTIPWNILLQESNLFIVGSELDEEIKQMTITESSKGSFIQFCDCSQIDWKSTTGELDILHKIIILNSGERVPQLNHLTLTQFANLHKSIVQSLNKTNRIIVFSSLDAEKDSVVFEHIPKLNKLGYKLIFESQLGSEVIELITKYEISDWNLHSFKQDNYKKLMELKERFDLSQNDIRLIKSNVSINQLGLIHKQLKSGKSLENVIKQYKNDILEDLMKMKYARPETFVALRCFENSGESISESNTNLNVLKLLEKKGLITFNNLDFTITPEGQLIKYIVGPKNCL